MPLNTHQQQAAFARRREVEHARCERLAAVNRYYDHWGKVTTRFENWTTPEYYKQAEEQLQERKDKKARETKLQARQGQLRALFATEKDIYEQELRERSKPKARRLASTETLQRIDDNFKERENIRRKLDLEAKLYSKWRHGVNDENAIFESKTDNEVLAKLNWLDKQVEEQLQRDREQAITQEHNLRLQVEINKTELAQKERQQIRKQEITEIRALQEKHMTELRERQQESETLKTQEQQLRANITELEKELELLNESSAAVLEPSEFSQAYNLKKIKIYIRKRSDVFRNHIKVCLSILDRMSKYASKIELLSELRYKYKAQLEAETYTLAQIEAMYESEAKYNLQRCEDLWQTQHMERYQELKELLKGEQSIFAVQINDNLQRQTDIIEMRSTHLAVIENSNEKLKQLIKEQEESPRGLAETDVIATPTPRLAVAAKSPLEIPTLNLQTQSSLPQLSKSFTNLNLDVWQDLPSARGGIDSPRLQSQRSLQVVTPETAGRPKFARKRIAWN